MRWLWSFVALLLATLSGLVGGVHPISSSTTTTTARPVSILASYYVQAGIPITLRPPRSGIYNTAIVVYNPLPYTFQVQNGTQQNTLAAGSAQLFAMPSSGSPLTLVAPANNFVYGSYLGPIQVVWFDPDDTPGVYPTPLNPPSGPQVQWSPGYPDGTFIGDVANDYVPYFVPTGTLVSVTLTNYGILSADLPEITVYGYPSGDVIGGPTASPTAGQSVTIPVTPKAGDTEIYMMASDAGGGGPELFVGYVSLGFS